MLPIKQQPTHDSRHDHRLPQSRRHPRSRRRHQGLARVSPPHPRTQFAQNAQAAQAKSDGAGRRNSNYNIVCQLHHARTHSVIYSQPGCRRNVCSFVYSTLTSTRMTPRVILAKCLHMQSAMTELAYELKLLTWMVTAVLVFSVAKVVYYHFSSTYNVRRIKKLLETRRPYQVSSTPVSPLPKIERVPSCLTLRRRSSLLKSSSLTDLQEQIVQPHSPPSRSALKTSTAERPETEFRRRKNQIMPTELLV